MVRTGSSLVSYVPLVETLYFLVIALVLVLSYLSLAAIACNLRNNSRSSRKWFWISAVTIGLVLAFSRMSGLWYFAYLNRSGQESGAELLLLLPLYPEVLAMPHQWVITASNVWLLSTLLTIGSVTMALAVGLLLA